MDDPAAPAERTRPPTATTAPKGGVQGDTSDDVTGSENSPTNASEAAAAETAAAETNGPEAAAAGTTTTGTTAAETTAAEPETTAAEPETAAAAPELAPKKKRRSFVRELPFLIGIAVVLALLLRLFLVQTFYIPSSSMENTLAIGDRVLVNKAVYEIRDIRRGEIVVFNGADSFDSAARVDDASHPLAGAIAGTADVVAMGGERDYIKRVIGLPGDSVACCDAEGRLTVNDVPLDESEYLFPGDRPSLAPFDIVVPEGRLWVMGDHRSVSQDSRSHLGEPGGGAVPIDKVVGKAFMVIWPISHWRMLEIPETFKQPEIDANAGH